MHFPIVIKTKHFPPLPFEGISLCGFMFFRKDIQLDDSLVRHEAIHFRQQLEWLFLFFFILYLVEFFYNLCLSHDWEQAYKSISFEREAYQHMHDADYLRQRRIWGNYRKSK